MSGELALRVALLDAAVKHARVKARGPVQRRAYVLFWLGVEAKESRRQREYYYSNVCSRVRSACEQAPAILMLLEAWRGELTGVTQTDGDPHCNTGPTVLEGKSEPGSSAPGARRDTVKPSARNNGKARVYEA